LRRDVFRLERPRGDGNQRCDRYYKIKGAIATIKRLAPVIITTLPAEATSDIIDALQALDYRLVDKVGGDYVYMKGEPI